VEPEPEIWVPVPQRQFVGQAIQCFSIFLDQIVLERSQKLQDVGARDKKYRCPELGSEPEISVPAPQP